VRTETRAVGADGALGAPRAGATPTRVLAGKNIEKKNATNAVTQALRDALGLYLKKLKSCGSAPPHTGSAATERAPAAAAASAAASAGPEPPPFAREPPPMLVKKEGATRDAELTPQVFERGVQVQRKMNGIRAVAYLPEGDGSAPVVLYSRSTGRFPGFAAIRGELAGPLGAPPPVPADLLHPPPGCPRDSPGFTGADLLDVYDGAPVYLDGEIYVHGESLRWLSGQARREADVGRLVFHVFDCFWPAAKAAGHDMCSVHRQAYLSRFFDAAAQGGPEMRMPHVHRVETFEADSREAVEALSRAFIRDGYEGAIVRKNCERYVYSIGGYHAAALVKIKPLEDAEFEVIGFTEGRRGRDVGAVIWICAARGRAGSFTVVPKGMTIDERKQVFRCLGEEVDNSEAAIAAGGPPRLTRFLRDFKGQMLTVEYFELSDSSGKPSQPKAAGFRVQDTPGALNPLRRLFDECQPAR
jgi:ATP-dependent DNA ligase